MNQEAAKTMKYGGLSANDALKLVTLNPAIQLGIDSRVGSIDVGKDADLVIYNHDPLSVYAVVQKTSDRRPGLFRPASSDIARRAALAKEKQNLLDKEKKAEPKKKNPNKSPKRSPTKPNRRRQPSSDGGAQRNRRELTDLSQRHRTASRMRCSGRSRCENQLKLSARSLAICCLWPPSLAIPRSWTQTAATTYAIKGGKVFTLAGPAIQNGTLIIRDGKIAAVGANIAIPSDAQVIDATGLEVYPGMFDPVTQIGLNEVSAVSATVDVSELGDYNPELVAATAVNPASAHIPVTRANGITEVIAAPGTSSLDLSQRRS